MGKSIVTFGGNFCYYPLMRYDLTYADRTYMECAEKLDGHVVKYVETKEQDRKRRIARMLLHILDDANDDITIVDSDVFIPSFMESRIPFTYCIPARAKPHDYIIVFCSSTNIQLPYTHVDRVKEVVKNYLDGKYWSDAVDINIHMQVPHVRVGKPGTRHYVNGICYELDTPTTFRRCDTK